MAWLARGWFLLRWVLASGFLLVLLAPAWWVAGRIQDGADAATRPFFRLLLAAGLALGGYVVFVNLLGRLTRTSIAVVLTYLALNAIAGVALWRRAKGEFQLGPLLSSRRAWIAPLLIALVLAFPQWLLAVSTNYWDEAASSAIYLTASNQFAQGLFPPRHNAFPDVPLKYHYGFTMLGGTVQWLTGLSANVSIDVVSTALWLFVFLFVYFWFRQVGFGRLPATWASFSALLGGGLAWLYRHSLEAYKSGGYDKVPAPAQLLHRWDPAKGWLDNLAVFGQVPSLHLRNADGSLSNLPWDVAAQFQQHAVSLGIAMTLVALYLLTRWMQKDGLDLPLLVANVLCFGVLFVAHAVFAGVAIVTAGLCLLGAWLVRRDRFTFYRGFLFTIGVAGCALVHGGMLARGAAYGTGGFTTLRKTLGYAAGGISGFLHWNLAGFGLPLLLTLVAWIAFLVRRRSFPAAAGPLFAALSVFAAFSYLIPQTMFYTSESSGVELFTEISKFFFCTHFALALLGAFAIALVPRRFQGVSLAAGFLVMAVIPLATCYAGSFDARHKWLGFYTSPYEPIGGKFNIEVQMGEALHRLKRSNRDTYFDASADEIKTGYLSAMLIYGGSVFTATPSRFERNGIGFRLAESVVAERYVENGRLIRLRPGATEAAGCNWYDARPDEDLATAPVIVRSRFDKLVKNGYLVKRFAAGARVLYSINKPTADIDKDIELYWRPRIVAPAKSDIDGDGKGDLVFYDYRDHKIRSGAQAFDLPAPASIEFCPLYVARFPGNPKADFLLGRMEDTFYRMGKRIEEIVERSSWAWSYQDSMSGRWQPEYRLWTWNGEATYIADLDHDGFDEQFSYQPRTGQWQSARRKPLAGPTVDEKDRPLPLGGRFLPGSSGDLGLWSAKGGMLTLKSLSTGQQAAFKWGGRPGDVLVPGDYDGDGFDEVAVWQRTNRTWYWRHAPDGEIGQATFGSATGIPVPFDFDHDGRIDLAYWEPSEGKVYVSFSRGARVDLTVDVPPHSLPAFVNWY